MARVGLPLLAANGNTREILRLLDGGAAVDEQHESGATALLQAA